MIKQRYTGKVIGGFMDTFGRSATLVSFFMLGSQVLILYSTVVEKYTPWVSFTVYAICCLLVIVITIFMVWRIIMPSTYGFFNYQRWTHDNPERRALEAIFRYFGIPPTKDMKLEDIKGDSEFASMIDKLIEIKLQDKQK